VDGDRAALIEQRDFLLASLDDLDREREAGDIDDGDYQALRDDYTARAAAVVRALERHDAAPEETSGGASSRLRAIAIGAVVVVFAVAAGLVIANNFGERTAGESLISEAPTSNREKVSQAQQLEASGDPDALAEAAQLYDEVLDSDPENVDALTYKGWLLVRAGLAEGVDLLDQAIALRPGFAPPHVFKAVALRNQGDPEAALAELDAVDSTQLSAFAGLVTNLRQELEARVAAGATTTTTTP
jgi:tetratricopeptide (TPR) repeat protein